MRAPVISAVAVIGLVVVAQATGHHHADTPTPQPSPPSAVQPTSGEPVARHERFGVPIGWSHDRQGGAAAAVSAVSLTGEVARAGFVTRSDMITVLASKRFASQLARSSNAQLSTVLGDLADDGIATSQVVLREVPLTVTVASYGDDRATVQVWSVVVAGADGLVAPRQLWRTVTVELVWEDGDWKLDAWSTSPGPTPALATDVPIATFDDVATVAAWSPASATGGE